MGVQDIKWKRKESSIWLDNGETEENLLKDNYTIQIQPNIDFENHDELSVEVQPNILNEVEVFVKRKPELGSVKINIFPKITSTTGIKWKIKNVSTNWYNSGETIENILVGNYEIEFQLNDYVKEPEVLRINILKNTLTEVDFIFDLLGIHDTIKENINISSTSFFTCDLKTPNNTYVVTFSGLNGVVLNATEIVPYGNKLTVKLNNGFVFSEGGLNNYFTTTGTVESLTNDELKTGIIIKDCDYSFNTQWLDRFKEEIGFESNTEFSLSYGMGKDTVKEDVGFLSANDFSAEIKITLKPTLVEESICAQETISTLEIREPIIKESKQNSLLITTDTNFTLDLIERMKQRSGANEDLGFLMDIAGDFFIKDKSNHTSINYDDVIIGFDIPGELFLRSAYKQITISEDLFFSSNDEFSQETYYEGYAKNNLNIESLGISSDEQIAVNIHDTKYLTETSPIEEQIGYRDVTEIEVDIKSKTITNISPTENIGFLSSDEIVLDITDKLIKNTSIENIGFLSNDELYIDITNKAKKVDFEEEVYISSVEEFTLETRYPKLEKISLEENLGLMSNDEMVVDIHSIKYNQNTFNEDIGLTSNEEFSVDIKNPSLERTSHTENIYIESVTGLELDIKINNVIPEKQIVEWYVGIDTVTDVTIRSLLNEKIDINEPIGILSRVVFELAIIDHLRKGNFSEDLFINSFSEVTVDIKSHLIKQNIEESIYCSPNEITIDILNKELKFNDQPEEAFISSGNEITVDIKVKSFTSEHIEEIGLTSDTEISVDITEKEIKTESVNEDINISSNTEFTLDLKNKFISNDFENDITISSNTPELLEIYGGVDKIVYEESLGTLANNFIEVNIKRRQ